MPMNDEIEARDAFMTGYESADELLRRCDIEEAISLCEKDCDFEALKVCIKGLRPVTTYRALQGYKVQVKNANDQLEPLMRRNALLEARVKALEEQRIKEEKQEEGIWFTPEMVWSILDAFTYDEKDRRRVDPDWVEVTGKMCLEHAQKAFGAAEEGADED